MKSAIFLLLSVSIALSFLLFLPFSAHITNALPNSVDPLFYAWNLSHNVQSASRGFSDLLDTNIFYPETNTLALSDTLYAQSIMTAPIILLTNNPILAENLYVLATFPVAAIVMFFLSYYVTGHTWASALSGLFYAFSYPRLSQIGHMPAISSQWLPLVFLYLLKYLRERKFWYLILLFIWFLASITSTIYFGIFLIPLAVLVALFEAKRNLMPKYLRDMAIIIFPALVILTIALFPYIRLRAEYPGIKRSLEDTAKLAAAPIDYISVLPTSWLSDLGFPTNTNERALYPTLTLATLALPAIFSSWGIFTLVAFALSFPGPYAILYKIYPLLQSVRVPARFSIFVILGLSVLAAYTLSRIKNKSWYLIIFLLFLTEIWQSQTPFVGIPNAPPVYEMIKAAPEDTIIVELPLHPEWLGRRMEDQLMIPYEDVTENDVFALEAYRTYFSAFHQKRMLNGYSGYFPTIYHDHASVFDRFPTPDAIKTLEKRNVRYILIHANQYQNEPYADIEEKIRDYPELKLVAQFGTDYVYEVR